MTLHAKYFSINLICCVTAGCEIPNLADALEKLLSLDTVKNVSNFTKSFSLVYSLI